MTPFTHCPFQTHLSQVKDAGPQLARRLLPGKDNDDLFQVDH
jgi:hypothetical protein